MSVNKWELMEHNGTHIDAPCHFIAKTQTLEQLPVRNLIVAAAVIDISGRAKRDADSAVTIDDVKAWEKNHGRLPRGSAVFMNSGWDVKAGDPQAYLGTDKSNTLHFPGFAEDTCQFLVTERDIAGIGVDTISLDIGPDKEFKAHKALLRGNKWGLECVANLSRIPPSGATVFVGRHEGRGAAPAAPAPADRLLGLTRPWTNARAAGVIGVGSAYEKQMIATTPLGRIRGQPSDIAPTAVFLASDESGWLTGVSISALLAGGAQPPGRKKILRLTSPGSVSPEARPALPPRPVRPIAPHRPCSRTKLPTSRSRPSESG